MKITYHKMLRYAIVIKNQNIEIRSTKVSKDYIAVG